MIDVQLIKGGVRLIFSFLVHVLIILFLTENLEPSQKALSNHCNKESTSTKRLFFFYNTFALFYIKFLNLNLLGQAIRGISPPRP